VIRVSSVLHILLSCYNNSSLIIFLFSMSETSQFSSEIREVNEQLRRPSTKILITEDNSYIGSLIAGTFKGVRGNVEEDSGVIHALDLNTGRTAINELMENVQPGDNIIHIADLEMPVEYDEDEILPDVDVAHGLQLIAALQKRVKEWNEEHLSEEPLILRVFVNSTKYDSPEHFEKIAGDHNVDTGCVIGGLPEADSAAKARPLIAIQEYFIEKSFSPESSDELHDKIGQLRQELRSQFDALVSTIEM